MTVLILAPSCVKCPSFERNEHTFWGQIHWFKIDRRKSLRYVTRVKLYSIRDSSHFFFHFSIELSPNIYIFEWIDHIKGSLVAYGDCAIWSIVTVSDSVSPWNVNIFFWAWAQLILNFMSMHSLAWILKESPLWESDSIFTSEIIFSHSFYFLRNYDSSWRTEVYCKWTNRFAML